MNDAAGTLRIRSARELLSAMQHPHAAVRKAVIAHVGQQPEQALAFGAHRDRDVVDALIDADNAGKEREEILGILWAMQSLADDRLAGHCAERLLHCSDDRQSLLLYRYLATQDLRWPHDVLQPLLWQTARLTNAELAARLLAGEDCEAAARVRISAILGREGAALRGLDSNDLSHWLKELHGPWAGNARECLAGYGQDAYALLAAHWENLDHATQRWLLRRGMARHFPGRTSLIERALQSTCEEIILQALHDTDAIRDAGEILKPVLQRLLRHERAAIRAAAMLAGARPADWQALLDTESDPGVLGACLAGLARDHGAGAIPHLLDGLEHADWTVVATATAALVDLGEEARAAVEPLAGHPALRVRVAADRILGASPGATGA